MLKFLNFVFTALITVSAVVMGILLTEKRTKSSQVKDSKKSLPVL
jgi:hypothetical protein